MRRSVAYINKKGKKTRKQDDIMVMLLTGIAAPRCASQPARRFSGVVGFSVLRERCQPLRPTVIQAASDLSESLREKYGQPMPNFICCTIDDFLLGTTIRFRIRRHLKFEKCF